MITRIGLGISLVVCGVLPVFAQTAAPADKPQVKAAAAGASTSAADAKRPSR